MSSVIASPIRPVSAGLDDEQPFAYGITRFPNGLYALLRLDLGAEGDPGEVEWKPCSHSHREETIRDSARRWTGLELPLWWIRGEDRTRP